MDFVWYLSWIGLSRNFEAFFNFGWSSQSVGNIWWEFKAVTRPQEKTASLAGRWQVGPVGPVGPEIGMSHGYLYHPTGNSRPFFKGWLTIGFPLTIGLVLR